MIHKSDCKCDICKCAKSIHGAAIVEDGPPHPWEKTLSPWERIVRAGKRGEGLRLSADEVWALRMDDAIVTTAQNEEDKRNGYVRDV